MPRTNLKRIQDPNAVIVSTDNARAHKCEASALQESNGQGNQYADGSLLFSNTVSGLQPISCESQLRPYFESAHGKSLHRQVEPISSDRASAGPKQSLRIAIHTLGRFSVVIDGVPLSFPNKAPKKPLDLLKALIALGGRCVDIEEIMTLTWPEQGAAARPAFDVALMRLRKLLGAPIALELSDGKLTLNQNVCWVDAWTLERAIAQLDCSPASHLDQNALYLYRGRFLDREGNAPWIVNMRDRLTAKFRRIVLKLARIEEDAQRWNEAAQLYRHGLEHDNLTEEFYYRLMHCELRAGQRSEAINTYRRCRDLLSLNLQTKPSPAMNSLYRRATDATSVCEP